MKGPSARLHGILVLALAALTIVVYAPVRNLRFVNYDDNVYVTDNARIVQGLTTDNLAWSLTAFVGGNWHPLTLVSHMTDVQAFGLDPAGHHATSLALHVANVLLLFWLLAGATRQPWPSALVAAWFAVHPLNVQTVAWIAERKSLLSTAFWLSALIAYAGYRRVPRLSRYLLVVVCSALALAAKPMAVTLPVTIVLFDVWLSGTRANPVRPSWQRYARELAPVVALALACGVLTLSAQRAVQAIQTVEALPLSVRLENAVVSYVWYLKTMLWPAGLAVFYPHPMEGRGVGIVVICLLVLVALSAIALAKRRVIPELATGWSWYIATLAPVAGIIQVGAQAYADRYAYVPLIGVFIAIAWTVVRFMKDRPAAWRRASTAAGVVSVAALALVTRAEIPYWHDSVSLFERAISTVPGNALAQNNLGMALVERDEIAAALPHFEKAVELAPRDTDARSNLGNALRALGRPADAASAYAQALEQAPADASIHYNLATSLLDLGRQDDAIVHLHEAVRLNPEYAKARLLLGVALYRRGQAADALEQFRELARRDPSDRKVEEWIHRIEQESGSSR
jgi:tetratricopeptide (TPR) repeat protein